MGARAGGGDGEFMFSQQKWGRSQALQTDSPGCIKSEPSAAAKHPEVMKIYQRQKRKKGASV